MQFGLGINCHATDSVSTTNDTHGNPRDDVLEALQNAQFAANTCSFGASELEKNR